MKLGAALLLLALTSQAAAPLPEDWFDADEWHLLVRYIITPGELASFRAVKTAHERSSFIDRFWKRRDREEFERRIGYANRHFEDRSLAPHPGFETDRGRIYVLFGAPKQIEPAADRSRERWEYASLSFEFALPAGETCDASFHVVSPPRQTFRGMTNVVRVYPSRFIMAHIPVDFARASSIHNSLTLADGRPVPELDGPIVDGQLGPAGSDPLSKHFLTCRMWDAGGMAFTEQVPAGRYIFTSTIRWLDGRTTSDTVPFLVP